jgi:hypothetical protein
MNKNLIPNKDLNLSTLGMLTLQERQYLYEYTKQEYSGNGEIVDLGCWLGSSTIPLAMGLVENANPQTQSRKIHAYDIFVWEAWMDQLSCVIGTQLEGKFQPGDSFFEECQRQTSSWEKQICYHPGDLTQLGWQGGEIEFLFIDAMKSWELANIIIHDFFPSLIPGRSTIVHQDFVHYYTYWIHLTMYRFREYFDVVYDIPYSSSLVYKYKKAIPEELLKNVYSIDDFSVDEISMALNYSSNLVSKGKRPIVLAGKIKAFSESKAEQQGYLVEKGLADLYTMQAELNYLYTSLSQPLQCVEDVSVESPTTKKHFVSVVVQKSKKLIRFLTKK